VELLDARLEWRRRPGNGCLQVVLRTRGTREAAARWEAVVGGHHHRPIAMEKMDSGSAEQTRIPYLAAGAYAKQTTVAVGSRWGKGFAAVAGAAAEGMGFSIL